LAAGAADLPPGVPARQQAGFARNWASGLILAHAESLCVTAAMVIAAFTLSG